MLCMDTKSLSSMILEKGVRNVNLSMLDRATKNKLLTDVAEILLKQGKHTEAISTFAAAENMARLNSISKDFMEQKRFKFAALSLVPTKDRSKLEEMGHICIGEKLFNTAKKAFEAAGNTEMVSFIEENFPDRDMEIT